MNDGYGYDPYGQQPEILGYDEYGRPVYRQDPGGQDPGGQDPHGSAAQGPYAPYDPYAQQQPQPGQPQPGYDSYGQYPGQTQPGQQPQQGYYDPYAQEPQGQAPHSQSQPPAPQQTQQQDWFPQQAPAPQQESYEGQQQAHRVPQQQRPAQQPTPGPGSGQGTAPGDAPDYRTEQFAFVEEPTGDSEDVIDWLKFSESRTERREEAKRRGRNKVVALIVALVLVVVGGVGYLWYAGMLPGLDGPQKDDQAAGGQQRDVIVVHLRNTEDGGSSTALLVENKSAGEARTVLLPNTLAVTTEDGTTTTLGRSVEAEGAAPTREALDTLLGAEIKGTWRLDTPYLETLVELVGGIALDTDATVPGKKKGDKPQIRAGKAQDLDGNDAVAYATYRAPGEPESKQLSRFGQVMQATLKKLSSDPDAATKMIGTLGQIPDPSLSEPQLGASLAKLSARAKDGEYHSQVLPVQANGTLSRQVSEDVVKKVLGGTVKNSDPGAALRVSVKNGSGDRGADDAASVSLVNGGYTVVKGGAASGVQAKTLVSYDKAAQKAKAEEVAKTLGLGGGAVRQAKGAPNADISVVLGRDYKKQ